MRKLDLELTVEEMALLSQLNFEPTRDECPILLEPMGRLAESLLDRGGVPQIRVRYFTDSERNPGGRGKSREDIFVGNGTSGDDILRHPNFLKILDYFLHGPDLPTSVMAKFRDHMSGGHISGSDVNDLAPYARKITREEGLEPHRAGEEFYKLVLECGGPTYAAESLRKSVLAIR